MEAERPTRSASQVWRGRLSEAEAEAASPPFQVVASDFLLTVVEFDRAAVKSALPEGLQLGESVTGFVGFYRAQDGPGLAPYSACSVSVEVQSHRSPETSPLFIKLAGWYSGNAGAIMPGVYDSILQSGEIRHWHKDDIWRAEAGPAGRPAIAAELRQIGRDASLTSDTHHFIGRAFQEGYNFYSISFSEKFIEAECLRLEVLPGAPASIRDLSPTSLFCYYTPTAFLTFSRPQQFSDLAEVGAANAGQMMLLDVFLRLGRAAAILDGQGQILFLNKKAKALDGDAFVVTRQHLRAACAADQGALQALIEKACAGEHVVEPILLHRSEGSAPLLVRAMPMTGNELGETAILLLFTDPLDTWSAGVVRLLQLLGLTPAEARIAVLVGTGAAPKRAAEELGIAENTVRSALKSIYDKLAISRQSELAQITARLEAL